MNTKEIKFTLKQYTDVSELSEEEQRLLIQARGAATKAYSPYSSFSVGAAVLLENEQIITGNNQENGSFPAGICAEQVALAFANANYPETAVRAIAISAIDTNGATSNVIRPCGICRQVMVEVESRFSKPIKVIMDGHSGIEIVDKSSSLMPLSFEL